MNLIRLGAIGVILASLAGIISAFMPWVVYPKAGASLYGYMGDGLITGALSCVSLIIGFLALKNNTFSMVTVTIPVIGIALTYIGYNKIVGISTEQSSFATDNPYYAAASAGFHQGSGLYILTSAGIFLTLFSVLGFIYQRHYCTKENLGTELMVNKKYIILTIAIIVSLMVSVFVSTKGNQVVDNKKETILPLLRKGINEMGSALKNGDFELFLAYNHPIMIEGLGGKEKIIDLLTKSMAEMKSSGKAIKSINVLDILDISDSDYGTQVLFTQEVIYSTAGADIKEVQKVIAISGDGGIVWHYINTSGKTKEELTKFFPYLDQNLKFQ